MIKTLLVHLRGTSGDKSVLAAALILARPFAAHLECLHIRPQLKRLVSRAAVTEMGEDLGAISEVLETLKKQSSASAQRAADAFATFCDAENIPPSPSPSVPGTMNAAFQDTCGDEIDLLIEQSRFHDLLIVDANSRSGQGLPFNELGRLITSAGRPILLAPNSPPRPIRNVVIAWKDGPEAARAVTAAMPILEKAEKIFVVATAEDDTLEAHCENVVKQLAWHGLTAQAHSVVPGGRDAAHAVLETARAADADLLVMGAYGHNRLRETILGGFTQSIIEDASLSVFMLH